MPVVLVSLGRRSSVSSRDIRWLRRVEFEAQVRDSLAAANFATFSFTTRDLSLRLPIAAAAGREQSLLAEASLLLQN